MDNLLQGSELNLTPAIPSTPTSPLDWLPPIQNSPVMGNPGIGLEPDSDLTSPQDDSATLSDSSNPHLDSSFGNLPLSFIANVGQIDPEVEFLVQGAQHDIFFTPDEIVLNKSQVIDDETISHQVKVSFAGANPDPTIDALAPLPGVANFITGDDPSQWHENVPTYQGIEYDNLYDGIDLIYRGDGGELKSEFIVSPGVDPGQIRMNYTGGDRLNIREDGALVIETPFGELVESAPYLYQDINGERVTVSGAYQLLDNAQVGFTIGEYDPSVALAIDPTLEYINYFGSNQFDSAQDIAVDEAGNIYVVGRTSSGNRPEPFQTKAKVLISKFSNNGTLLYTTVLGSNDLMDSSGNGNIRSGSAGADIAVDSNGNVYVTGSTRDADFPTLNGFQSTFEELDIRLRVDNSSLFRYEDSFYGSAFITKLSNNGSLVYSTFLGGTRYDAGHSIAADKNGNIYVTGTTLSEDFPTVNVFQNTFGGSNFRVPGGYIVQEREPDEGDAFVTKLSSEGDVVYSTFLGGSENESGRGITVDSEGNAYITGGTFSSDFPLVNAIQSNLASSGDAFISKISHEGNLLYSTLLGSTGGNRDVGRSIAVDASQNIYVTGAMNLPYYMAVNPPPVVPGPPLSTTPRLPPPPESSEIRGSETGFVTKISSDGNRLLYLSLLGGGRADTPQDIVVDRNGSAYVTGSTRSAFFPNTVNAFQENLNNTPLVQPPDSSSSASSSSDAFVTKFSPDGIELEYSTYLGGTSNDTGNGIALDNAGNVYITGTTSSVDIPNATGFLLNSMENNNGFIAKITPEGQEDALELPSDRLFPFTFLVNVDPISILFDEQFYLSQNLDVAEAVKAGLLVNGLAHFEASGQAEGRQPSPFYNEARYLADNPDVAQAVATGAIRSGFDHFRDFGFFEGRDRRLHLFDEGFYLKTYPDIRPAIRDNLISRGFNHYIQFGQKEGRNPNLFFDEIFYLENNPDVAAAVTAGSFASGFEHFARNGELEGRQPSPLFNEEFYRATYPDVNSAVIIHKRERETDGPVVYSTGGRLGYYTGIFSGFEHFLRFGFVEGRVGVG